MEKAKKEVRKTVITVPLNLSIQEESARRNVDVVFWYKKMIDWVFVLLIVSMGLISLAGIFALNKPFPDVYASTIDGRVYLLEYSRGLDEKINELREKIKAEENSRSKVK